jgi:hypothetical protein
MLNEYALQIMSALVSEFAKLTAIELFRVFLHDCMLEYGSCLSQARNGLFC